MVILILASTVPADSPAVNAVVVFPASIRIGLHCPTTIIRFQGDNPSLRITCFVTRVPEINIQSGFILAPHEAHIFVIFYDDNP